MSYSRIGVLVLWMMSVIAVAHWTAQAQSVPPPGLEIRFVPGPGKPGTPHGTLVANVDGQGLPVTLDTTPLPHPPMVQGR